MNFAAANILNLLIHGKIHLIFVYSIINKKNNLESV